MDRRAARPDPGGDRGAAAGASREPVHGGPTSSTPCTSTSAGAPCPTRSWSPSSSASSGSKTLPAAPTAGCSASGRAAPRGPSPRVRAPPRGGGRAARRGGDAAGHLLRVQPGGLRPERAYVMDSGVRLTSPASGPDPRGADQRVAWVAEEELTDPRLLRAAGGAGPGIAAHHAGMLPVFKETVEELFAAGLVKVVFATETLSLGINMPAKTVVIEDLWKFSGERHELLDSGRVHPADRAGRARRHRRDRRRRGPVPAAGPVRAGGRAGLDADVRAALARSGPRTT